MFDNGHEYFVFTIIICDSSENTWKNYPPDENIYEKTFEFYEANEMNSINAFFVGTNSFAILQF